MRFLLASLFCAVLLASAASAAEAGNKTIFFKVGVARYSIISFENTSNNLQNITFYTDSTGVGGTAHLYFYTSSNTTTTGGSTLTTKDNTTVTTSVDSGSLGAKTNYNLMAINGPSGQVTNFTIQLNNSGTLSNYSVFEYWTASNQGVSLGGLGRLWFRSAPLANGAMELSTFSAISQNWSSPTDRSSFIKRDTSPPLFYNVQSNSTYSGEAILLSVNWTSDYGLQNYTLSFDNGNGTFYNDSTVNFADVNSAWANVTKVLNATAGSVVRWIQYAYDDFGKFNATSIQSLTTVFRAIDGNLNVSFYENWVNAQQGTATNGTTQLGRIYYTDANSNEYTWDGDDWQNYITKSATPRRITLANHATERPTLSWVSRTNETIVVASGSWNLAVGNTGNIILNHSNGTVVTVYSITGNGAYQAFGIPIVVKYGSKISFRHAIDSASTLDGVQITGNAISHELTVSAFDENNPTTSKLYNLTISNNTNSTSYVVNYQWFNQSLDNLPSGVITLTVQNDTCMTGNVIPRQYTLNTANGGLNWTAYLLCDGANLALQQFIIQDQFSAPVGGATITIRRVIGSTNATISVLTTDGTGTATAYLTGLASYYVTVSKTGYTGTTTTITANTGQVTIPISVNNQVNTFDDVLLYANWTMTPAVYLDFPLMGVNVTIVGVGLQYYGLNLTLANGTELFFVNLTNATGSTINSPLFDINQSNGTLYAQLFIGKEGYTSFFYTRTFNFANQTNSASSVTGIIAYLKASDMSPSLKAVISLFLSLFFSVGGMFLFGAGGAGLAFVISLGFFGLVLGFIEEYLIYTIIIVSLAVYAISKGF